AFRDLCAQHGTDYYERLTYLAGDRSEPMLVDACRHGIFAQHPGRYRLRVLDALDPAAGLRGDPDLFRHGPRPLRAVFLNYLLDCLPACVLEFDGDQTRQLCVRTGLARGARLEEHTELTAGTLALRAGSADPEHQRDLLEVYGLLASEYDYRPVDLGAVPSGDFARAFGQMHPGRVLHNYGALRCLERLLELLRE